MVSAALFIASAIAFVNRSLNLSSKCQNPHVEGFHRHTQRQCDISPQMGVAGGGVQPQFSAELPPHSVVTAALVEAAAQSPVSVADQSLVAAV